MDKEINQNENIMPEPAGYYDNLTARQNLRFYAKLYDIDEKTREKEGVRYALEVQDLPVQRVIVIEGLKGLNEFYFLNTSKSMKIPISSTTTAQTEKFSSL